MYKKYMLLFYVTSTFVLDYFILLVLAARANDPEDMKCDLNTRINVFCTLNTSVILKSVNTLLHISLLNYLRQTEAV